MQCPILLKVVRLVDWIGGLRDRGTVKIVLVKSKFADDARIGHAFKSLQLCGRLFHFSQIWYRV